ncbi:acyltransferase family protein [Rhodococcus rhodnii]|uniref:acyltransferase family protein n=1 Tax=Rhodococcus rhodnii TaxID=38312 RepID=UPI00147513AD|nr:acyltransferase family protein [Rhodococcus rhodnii]
MPASRSRSAPAVSASSDAVGPARHEWVDVAKGVCIALVVLLHASNFLIGRGMAHPLWNDINALVQPIRMPLFFLASGLFLAKTLTMPWAQVLRRRVLPLLYLYVVWTFVRWAYFTLFPATAGTAEPGSIWKPIRALVIPDSGLWFIYALAVFAFVARALVRIPAVLQLVAAFGSAVAVPHLDFGSWTWHNMATLLVFYLLGVHAARHAHRIAAAATPARVAAAVLAFACAFALVRDGALAQSSLAHVATSTVGLVTGIAVAALLARHRVAAPFRRLGTRTLAVFLLHEIAFGTALALLLAAGLEPTVMQRIPVTPLLVAAFAIVVSLWGRSAFERIGLGVLFTMPPRLPDAPAATGRALRRVWAARGAAAPASRRETREA